MTKPHEEYLRRHEISVPLVEHRNLGSLIFRTQDTTFRESRWVLLTVRWEHHPHHPGHYAIEFFHPVHNAYTNGEIFDRQILIQKKWDEYETYFLDFVAGLKRSPVVGFKDVSLACWEMFVYAYDGWFSTRGFDLEKSLYMSLDKDMAVEIRYNHYQEVCLYLSTHHPGVFRTWKYGVLGRVVNYSDWLAKLAECNETIFPRPS